MLPGCSSSCWRTPARLRCSQPGTRSSSVPPNVSCAAASSHGSGTHPLGSVNAEYRQCRSVNLAIMVCNWVIPGLLIWYAVFLGVMYFWRKEFPAEESAGKRLSDLPMMLPSRRPSTRRPSILSAALRPAPVAVPEARSSNPSGLTPLSQLSRPSWLLSSSPTASPYSPSSPQRGIAY
ncbi:hypothetical protein BD413DRAFT_499918 [Trametes elegans]|nr:hypothetical protein BD413DRAFT_499918 [Trametes elegans]